MTTLDLEASDQYVASFGKDAALGCFAVVDALTLARGDAVVLETPRGQEVGQILCAASVRQARLLGAQLRGRILRPLLPDDQPAVARSRQMGGALLDSATALARELGSNLVLLDADVFLDGRGAVLQILDPNPDGLAPFVAALRERCGLDIRLANLAQPVPDEPDDHAGGCGKPDCGKSDGGSCSSCSSGGCSSGGCGAPGGADLRPYFAHLRTQMESAQRVSLI